MEMMGPVLECVLDSLSKEHEKQLRGKENEVRAARHEVKAAQTALKHAQEELYELHKAMAEDAHALPVCSVQPGMPFSARTRAPQIPKSNESWVESRMARCNTAG